MTQETIDMLKALEARYGRYLPIIKDDVAAYLERELDLSTREKQIAVKDAITAYQPVKDGPPDPATIDKAVWRWAQVGNGSLRKSKAGEDYCTAEAIEEPTEEERRQVEAMFPDFLALVRKIEAKGRE